MSFFRNPEIKKLILIACILTVGFSVFAFFQWKLFGFFVFAVCLSFTLLFLFYTRKRYQKIYELSDQIDSILHNGIERIIPDHYDEGELGVLESELDKMIIRLKEQQESLLEDKRFLADFVADVSHQIRTPLTSINLLVEFLSEPDLEEEKRYQLIHQLSTLLDRIDWLITTLLKISRLDADMVTFVEEKTSWESVLQKALSPLWISLDIKNQHVSIEAKGEISCDMSWTAEAIGNIVKNCMEHTPENGEICLKTSENAIYSQLIIEDTGSGIDKEDLPHIFERFYKGKKESKGFGIGLSLAGTIVIAQNGTIKAENRKEKGARFILRFYKTIV